MNFSQSVDKWSGIKCSNFEHLRRREIQYWCLIFDSVRALRLTQTRRAIKSGTITHKGQGKFVGIDHSRPEYKIGRKHCLASVRKELAIKAEVIRQHASLAAAVAAAASCQPSLRLASRVRAIPIRFDIWSIRLSLLLPATDTYIAATPNSVNY